MVSVRWPLMKRVYSKPVHLQTVQTGEWLVTEQAFDQASQHSKNDDYNFRRMSYSARQKKKKKLISHFVIVIEGGDYHLSWFGSRVHCSVLGPSERRKLQENGVIWSGFSGELSPFLTHAASRGASSRLSGRRD